MRRPLVAQRHCPFEAFALCLTLHQHRDPAFEQGDFGILPGDHVRKVIDRADQMGKAFFDVHLCHGVQMACAGRVGKGFTGCPCAMRAVNGGEDKRDDHGQGKKDPAPQGGDAQGIS